MYGKIYFKEIEEVAEFLKAFVGCTAVFTVTQIAGCWVLEFSGGY